jgi:DNA sulfur modification protein DndB
MRQIHQDFADCSKTKALPPSMLAVYDLRNPANKLVVELADKCDVFRGRIDSVSKTLSKKSTYLFLANQIRQLVKEFLSGSYATPDVQFEQRARQVLPNENEYAKVLSLYADYINHLTTVIPIWKEIAGLPQTGVEISQIPDKRQEAWVCLTATGLNLMGRVGHNLFKRGVQDWRAYATQLGQLRLAPIRRHLER